MKYAAYYILVTGSLVTSPSGGVRKYCNERVSVSVSLFALISQNTTHPTVTKSIFCSWKLWPWIGLSLTTMQYVVYFRFCGLRHVFT